MRYPFTQEARAQLRAVDRSVALGILDAIARFGETGAGDAAPLDEEWKGCYRLRAGAVGHRSEVYR